MYTLHEENAYMKAFYVAKYKKLHLKMFSYAQFERKLTV